MFMHERWATFFRRIQGDQAGNVLILGAMTMTIMVGAAGLGMDTVQWSLAKRQLQQTADAAAISGAYAKANQVAVAPAAQKEIDALAKVTLSTAAVIENAPTVGAFAGDQTAVRVALQASLSLPFSNMYLSGPTVIPATAVAKVVSSGRFCVLSLERTSATGIAINGNAQVALGCGMKTNSNGATAITASGSSTVNVSSLSAVGKVPTSSSYNTDVQIFNYAIAQPDPFASLPNPAVNGCGNSVGVQPNRQSRLGPGCYSGFDVKGTLNLDPGVYYVDGSRGGSFSIGSQGVINGTGVTIILTSKDVTTDPTTVAIADINAGATLNLSAPTTGTYAGVLMYQDRRARDIVTNLVNGNADSFLQGALYFPNQPLSFSGTAGMQSPCVQIVAKRVTMTGNSSITNVCPADSGTRTFDGLVVRLVA